MGLGQHGDEATWQINDGKAKIKRRGVFRLNLLQAKKHGTVKGG